MDTERIFKDLDHMKNQALVIASIEKIAKEGRAPVVLTCKRDKVTIDMCGQTGEGANAIEALGDVKKKLKMSYN